LRYPRPVSLAGVAGAAREGERTQLVRVGDEIDSGDAAAGDGEGGDGDRILAAAEQYACCAVDGDGAGEAGEPRGEDEDTPGDRMRAVQRAAAAAGARVGAEDDAGVEDSD
jgi:hypothetical protein